MSYPIPAPFLTFVLCQLLSICIFASPPANAAEPIRDDISITTPPTGSIRPMGPENDREIFYSYRHALTLRAGLVPEDFNFRTPLKTIGAEFLFYYNLNAWEGGADLHSDGSGTIHGSRRFIYSQNYIRPYSKLGVGIQVIPSEQLVTFLKYQHYQFRAGIGCEYLIKRASSVRLELEVIASLQSTSTGATLGYVWAW